MGRETAPLPHPLALAALGSVGIDTGNLAVQDWSAYARRHATPMNYVILLDEGAAYSMPTWPGHPVVAVWAYPDVIGLGQGEANLKPALHRLLFSLRRRIELFASLPFKAASRTDLALDVRDLAHLESYPVGEATSPARP